MHQKRRLGRVSGRTWSFVLVAMMVSAPAQAQEIDWQVKDRFRLFDKADPASRAGVENLLETIAATRQRPEGLALAYDQLLTTLSGREAAPLRRSNWDQARRKYASNYLYPGSYTIAARVTQAGPNASCIWAVDEAVKTTAPCSDAVELAIPGRSKQGRWIGQATVRATDSAGLASQSEVLIEDRLIVAIGDSYLSGEGNPDVPADLSRLQPSERFQSVHWPSSLDTRRDPVTVAEWWDEPCHRSLLSWPVLAGLTKASVQKREAVTLVHLGCSSATTKGGITLPQEDLPGCPKEMDSPRTCPPGRKEARSQIGQLAALLAQGEQQRPVDQAYMSVGGIDIGFRGLVAYDVLPAGGYLLGPLVPTLLPLVSSEEIICPYRAEASIRARFCWRNPTVEARFEKLPRRYDSVAAALTKVGIKAGGHELGMEQRQGTRLLRPIRPGLGALVSNRQRQPAHAIRRQGPDRSRLRPPHLPCPHCLCGRGGVGPTLA